MADKESYVRMGRVLHEDNDFILLEVSKDLNRQLDIKQGDYFLSLTFVHVENDTTVKWLPWKAELNED